MNGLFSRILVGIDDSQPAMDAVALAARLAQEHGGRLVLCHCVNWIPLVSQVESTGAYVDPTPIIESLKQQGEALLAQAACAAKKLGVEAERRLADGEPAENILAVAEQERCGLIAMGTRGRHGMGSLFVGSTAQAVLRGSTIPVLTVRAGRTAPPAPRCFERIVVGIDNSEPSSAALSTVLEFEAADRADLTFCTVVDVDRALGTFGQFHADEVRAELKKEADVFADDALARAREQNVAAKKAVVEGNAGAALLHFAEEHHADLVVVGSHGRRGVKRFFLGSVAESVVRAALVPVLVVRSAPGADVPQAAAPEAQLARS
jgi:nucleotide-binding universal stress UspA family protein